MRFSPGVLLLAALLASVAAQAPVVTVEPRSATVRQGESFSFKCHVSGAGPMATLEWRKGNNQPMPDNVVISGGKLTVSNARPGNQGLYRCTAANSAGGHSAAVVLNVKFAPKVQLTPTGPLRVRMGDAVSVECRATGRPRPVLTWRRQGSTLQLLPQEVNDANVLQWPAIHPSDSGVYICQGQNSEGMSEVKVEVFVEGGQGAPLASVSTREMTVVEGDTITMSCQATGNPPPVITWSKLRAPLPWKHTVADGVLTLTSVGRQDSGQYICNATNVHGYSEAYTQMEVESPPYATCVPDVVKLRAGNALHVQCLAHGSHPITFTWRRVGQPTLPPGAQTTSSGELVFAQVKVSDSGTYKCVATNHIGSSDASAKVVVRA